jgi:hypothetical protein
MLTLFVFGNVSWQSSFFSLFVFWFVFCSAEDWTWGLTCASQALATKLQSQLHDAVFLKDSLAVYIIVFNAVRPNDFISWS